MAMSARTEDEVSGHLREEGGDRAGGLCASASATSQRPIACVRHAGGSGVEALPLLTVRPKCVQAQLGVFFLTDFPWAMFGVACNLSKDIGCKKIS